MKKLFVALILLAGCAPVSNLSLSEAYIKLYIQKHEPSSYENVRIAKIAGLYTYEEKEYLELGAYRYEQKKGLVVAGRLLTKLPPKFYGDSTIYLQSEYYHLTLEQAQGLYNSFAQLRSKMQSTDTFKGEYVYQDYSIDKNFFLSLRATKGNERSAYIFLWMYGHTYMFEGVKLEEGLKNFLAY